MPTAQVITAVPGAVVAVAVLEQLGEPVTSEVASVCPFTNPVIVAVNDGFAAP